MRILKPICLFVLFAISFTSTGAQTKAGKTAAAPVKKFKPPVLTTNIAAYSDSILTLSVVDVQKVIGAPLIITDAKKTRYTITYYNLLYKRKIVTEDEQTGQLSPSTATVSDHFKTCPLPDIWQNTIREQVKPGEELYFFDIIVKDALGRVMYAPNLKITVK